MNLGELFIKLGVLGDTKKLDDAVSKMEKAQKVSNKGIKQSKNEIKANKNVASSINGISNALKSMSGGLKGTGGAISALGAMGGAAGSAMVAVGALVSAVTLTYMAIDRMVSSLASANQQMITFNRTSGISLSSLNKYASANAAVNYNATVEGTAQSMQRVAQNLWDIKMGRGDVSPYQELAFVGGKAFNPMGMSVEQVIESVREAIKGVDDLQATNIITRMGFAPEDLMMLRMSREEFEKINDMFLNPQQREAMNQYALELKQIQLGFQKTNQSLTIDLAKPFIAATKVLQKLWDGIYKLIIKPIMVGFKVISETLKFCVSTTQEWLRVLANTFSFLKPLLFIFRAIYLIFDDIYTYLVGGESYFGDFIEAISGAADKVMKNFKVSEIGKFFDAIENKIKSLSKLTIPSWLADFFSGKWIQSGLNLINPFSGNNPPAPVNTNKISNVGGNNVNTNNNFSISTNQPMEIVAENLINRFTPVQVQYGTVAV